MKKASELTSGMSASVQGWSEDAEVGRFLELGILLGSRIEVLHSAPFRGATYLKTEHCNYALRKEELAQILISA